MDQSSILSDFLIWNVFTYSSVSSTIVLYGAKHRFQQFFSYITAASASIHAFLQFF